MDPIYAQIEGGEFDWFAVDSRGEVAHFSAAGFGPVPVALLLQLNRIEGVPAAVQSLAVRGAATGHAPGIISDWLAMAERGCHSFDWKHWSGPYRRVATPSNPLNLEDLPVQLASLLRLIEFPTVSFAELSEIRPEWLCTCEQAPQATTVDREDQGSAP